MEPARPWAPDGTQGNASKGPAATLAGAGTAHDPILNGTQERRNADAPTHAVPLAQYGIVILFDGVEVLYNHVYDLEDSCLKQGFGCGCGSKILVNGTKD